MLTGPDHEVDVPVQPRNSTGVAIDGPSSEQPVLDAGCITSAPPLDNCCCLRRSCARRYRPRTGAGAARDPLTSRDTRRACESCK
jgi:hypothetical protein